MFHFPQFHPALAMLIAWFSENSDALLNASTLLGGLPAHRRTARLISELLTDATLTRRQMLELTKLLDLLKLENVGDPDSIEAECFSDIDPADPVVYDLCMLADGLEVRLEALREATGRERNEAEAA